jgi:hypothetical protein
VFPYESRIRDEDLILLKQYVIDYLIHEEAIPYENATRMVEESTFNEILFEEREYVMHFSVKYWAEDVLEENSVIL